MKKQGLFLLALLFVIPAKAYYQTFVKKVDWSLSKASVVSSDGREFKKVINYSDSSSIRLFFSKVRLGKGNFLKIEFPFKGKPLYMNDRIIKGFGNATPFLKGGEFRLSVVLKNKKRFGGLKVSRVEATRMTKNKRIRSLCGEDNQVRSDESKMGRLMRDTQGKGGCSGGLFSRTCLVTAGHCLSTTKVVEFHVPDSDRRGRPVPADPKNQYPRIEIIDTENEGLSRDWLVMRYGANPYTGKFPGDAQGFYKFNFNPVNVGDTVRVTGHGLNKKNKTESWTQKTHYGEIVKVEESLWYTVDTVQGNSGTPLVLESTNEIVGVHTNGGCTKEGGANKGTSLNFNKKLQAAMKACLMREKEELGL